MTTIQSNQPTHHCCPTSDAQQQGNEQEQSSPATNNNWQSTGTGDATTGNRFAGQVLAQQTNGPMTTTTTANEYGGMTLSTTVDMDGNGQNEASLTSAFDESGNLRSNSYTMDNSGDGVVDYGEAYTYDRQGNVTGHVVVEDTDFNGTMDRQSHTQDTDGNGLLDTQTTVTYDDDGNLTSRSVAQDVNEDGIMDFAFNETFDAEGNRTSYGTTIFEDGVYGSNSAGEACPCPGEPEEPEVIISPPSAGGTSTPEETPPAGPVNATASAEFVSESAGYDNALYTYDLDEQGNVTNIRQVIDNSNTMSGGASLGDVSTTDGQPNLLLLPNGANAVDENSQLTIVDGKLHVDGQEYSGDAYFSHSAEMSTDGKQHFQMTTDADGNTTVAMEDLRNLGDNDFNDLVIKVSGSQDSATPPSAGATSTPPSTVPNTFTPSSTGAQWPDAGNVRSGWNPESQRLETIGSDGQFTGEGYTGFTDHGGDGTYYFDGLPSPDGPPWPDDGNVRSGWNPETQRLEKIGADGKFTGEGYTGFTDHGGDGYYYYEGVPSPQGPPATAASGGDDVAPPSAGGTSAPDESGSQPVITGEVEIFEHSNFNGKKSTLGLGYYSYSDINAMGLNDKTSSLKVPEGMVVVAYEHDNKGGEQFVYTSDTSWVGGGANDKFSSFEVMTEAEYNARQAKTVQLFEHSNYGGDVASLTLEGNYQYFSHADINALGMNDKTSSLKVPEGMVLVAYEHDNKRGEKTVYDANSTWVGGGNNDKFSSFELMTEEEYAARQGKTVELFEHSNYKGDVASFTLQGDYQYISHSQINALGMNDKTSSLKVPEGMVVVAYEHDNKGGNKSVYTADSGWVGSGVNDKFSSLEIMTQAEYDERYGSSVEVFEHASYGGQSATLSAGFYDVQALKDMGLHDKISSIKVPEGMVLVTWEHGDKGGTRNVYREGDTGFVGGGNNDNISNMEIMTEEEYLERINNGGF